MKASVAAVFSIVLFAISTVAEKPKTVDEAIQVLKTKWLQPKDRDWILRNPKNEVWGRLYMGFGTGVRNEFGLWGDNQPLHDSCGTNNPERCSSVILNRLWESVRGDADPALVHQLDRQFAHAIHVSLKGFHQLTTREMIRRLQSQIDSQLPTLAAPGVPGCQRSLTLDVAGEPDNRLLRCSSASQAGSRIPKITLDFLRKCQFPKPFSH